jgi:hypothetical protein
MLYQPHVCMCACVVLALCIHHGMCVCVRVWCLHFIYTMACVYVCVCGVCTSYTPWHVCMCACVVLALCIHHGTVRFTLQKLILTQERVCT